VVGNLVFSSVPISGQIIQQSDNVVAPVARAPAYVKSPAFAGAMDFYPLGGQCQGGPLDLSSFDTDTDFSLDFNGASKVAAKGAPVYRGAYAGEGSNPGWTLAAGMKAPAPPAPKRGGTVVWLSPASGQAGSTVQIALTGSRRSEMVIATKVGLSWGVDKKQVFDASPSTLVRHCEESLRRLRTDRVELLYLHAPDPKVPVAESAGALRKLLDQGKTRSVGASNLSLLQLQEFVATCPIVAFQPAYNMLQRQIEADTLPWCRERDIAVIVYWPLMKGLLAGKMDREHLLDVGDSRRKYPMYQGEEWQRNQDFLDELKELAAESGRSVAQIVINWTIHRPGITAALCGAKRPEQIGDNAGALGWKLDDAQLARIDEALSRRGPVITRPPV
jgi:aryl-alcohol dehydrogenase-like predicted oxidoreductase